MTVTVYSQPACQPCRATKRKLDALGVDYVDIDVTQDPEARDYVLSLGYKSAPVVVAGDWHHSGYVPDALDRIARELPR